MATLSNQSTGRPAFTVNKISTDNNVLYNSGGHLAICDFSGFSMVLCFLMGHKGTRMKLIPLDNKMAAVAFIGSTRDEQQLAKEFWKGVSYPDEGDGKWSKIVTGKGMVCVYSLIAAALLKSLSVVRRETIHIGALQRGIQIGAVIQIGALRVAI